MVAENRLTSVLNIIRDLSAQTNKAYKDFEHLNRIINNLDKSLQNVSASGKSFGELQVSLDSIRQTFNTLHSMKPFDPTAVRMFNTALGSLRASLLEIEATEKRIAQFAPVSARGGFGTGATSGGPTTLTPASFAGLVQESEKRTSAERRTTQEYKNQQKELAKIQTQLRSVYKDQAAVFRKEQGAASLGSFAAQGNQYADAVQIQTRLNSLVKAYGMELTDVSSVQKDVVTGMTRFSAKTEDAYGRVSQLTGSVDRMGRVTTQSASSFKNLAGQIGQSIAQFAKFMVSATLIYGVLNAISEQAKVVVDNETELANIAIVLGDNQEKLAQVFEASAQAANLSAESINGVLEGYQQAIRATGYISDETERMRKANVLLVDSLILSKLSTLDQAKSMDILVAALRQSETPFENARTLLDRWVAVTKIANVDMRTLAESYAIVGTVAKSAGLEVGEANNELVGLIGLLAENTQLTPTETGNALRAVITGLNTDVAIRELNNYGIAVRDTGGEMRDFMTIALEVNRAFKEGLISESQLSAIAKAIGGGVRRQGQVEVILKDLDRALEINQLSAGKYGSAEDALAVQTDTLRDSVVRLSNAFQELAQTWGTDGGLLKGLTSVVKLITLLVDGMEKLSSIAGPNLSGLAVMLSIGALGKIGAGKYSLASGIDKGLGGLGIAGGAGQYTRGQYGAGILTGALSVGLATASNVREGNKEEAVANFLGGTIGAAIGGALGGPIGIQAGAIIGSSVAGAFVSGLTSLEGDLVASWRRINELAIEEEAGSKGGTDVRPLPDDREVLELLGGGNRVLGGFLRQSMSLGTDIWGTALDIGLIDKKSQFGQNIDQNRDLDQMETALLLLQDLDPKAFEALGARLPQVPADTQYERQASEFKDTYGGQLAELQEELLADLVQQMSQGNFSSKELGARRDIIGGLPSTVSNLLPSILTDGMAKIGDDFYELSDAVDILSHTLVFARDEEITVINQVVSRMRDIETQLEKNKQTHELTRDEEEALRKEHEQLTEANAQLLEVTRARIAAEAYVVPGLSRMQGEFTQQGLSKFRERLPQAQIDYEQALYGASPESMQIYKEGLKPNILQTGGGYIPFSELGLGGRNYDPTVISQVLSEIMEESGNVMGGGQNPGFLNLPFAAGSDAYNYVTGPGYDQLRDLLAQAGYSEELSDLLVISSDNQIEAMQRDNTIIQMLLSQIEENTSDVVDGIYNLPTDGSFFVPFTGYRFGYNNDGGLGGLGALEDLLYTLISGFESSEASYGIGSAFDGYRSGAHYGKGLSKVDVDPTRKPRRDYRGMEDTRGFAGTYAGGGIRDYIGEVSGGARMDGGRSLPDPLGRGADVSALSDAIYNSISTALDTTPIKLGIDISAVFETFLDGELMSTIVKRYMTEELIRKGDSSGNSVVAVTI